MRRIISSGQNWKKWVLCDRDPAEHWNDGRATLLGDAAHPTLQYFAQGACMAMEDGMCLARARSVTPEAMWSKRSTSTDRSGWCERRGCSSASRLIGDHIFHPSGAHALTRNATLGAMDDRSFQESLAWLYDGRQLWAA